MLISDLGELNIIASMAIPMIVLVLIEWAITWYKKLDYYDGLDTLSSTVIGLVNVGLSALLKIAMFGLILFFYNLVPWSIPRTWWSFILCIVSIDFFRYWAHRIAHVNRFWWASHVTHHNSNKYNWSTSFRLGWTQHIKIIFFVPIAIMGFDPVVFFICHQLAVLYQFWIHTQYINKLPAFIEYIFVTPSHHRVHHGKNAHYLDKNYGSTLIIWDRMFGSFQAEDVPVDYGITKTINSRNPLISNFHEWQDILKDIGSSRSIKEAYQLTFSSPADLEAIKESLKKNESNQNDYKENNESILKSEAFD
jgi:sterol desaturase/sphingolipid hydroxylase (fatty acid hydroxylase superfamily)